jgi:hypothetical protein
MILYLTIKINKGCRIWQVLNFTAPEYDFTWRMCNAARTLFIFSEGGKPEKNLNRKRKAHRVSGEYVLFVFCQGIARD